jgi:hypothetical protein
MNIIKEFALVIEETPSQGQSSHDAQSKEEPVELFVFAVASQPFQPPQRIIAARTEPIIISALIVRGPFRLSAFFSWAFDFVIDNFSRFHKRLGRR